MEAHRTIARTLRLAPFFAFVACLASVAFDAAAGEARGAMPLRADKVREGDWILYRMNGELVKETAMTIERFEDDVLINYSIEKFAPDGAPSSREEVSHFLSIEKQNSDDLAQDRKVKRDRRRVKIDGKNVNVLVATFTDEVPYEMWYSDDISVTGLVAMVTRVRGEEPFWSIQPLAFGAAGSNPNIKRYLGAQ